MNRVAKTPGAFRIVAAAAVLMAVTVGCSFLPGSHPDISTPSVSVSGRDVTVTGTSDLPDGSGSRVRPEIRGQGFYWFANVEFDL
jgi:hypothetical protein